MKQIKETEQGLLFQVKVIPAASKNALVGWENGALKIRLNTAPEKGKANQALIAFLAEELHLSKSVIHIVSGKTSRLKMIQVQDKSVLKTLTDLKA